MAEYTHFSLIFEKREFWASPLVIAGHAPGDVPDLCPGCALVVPAVVLITRDVCM